MISCCDWWLWTKPGYIITTGGQINNQWSVGIAAHPAPKNSEYKNLLEKFSPRFFGIKMVSLSLIIFQRAKLSTWNITHLCWCNWRTFRKINAAGRSPRGSCSCMTMPRLTRHLQPRRNWPTWASSVLITHPILRIWPDRTTTCSLGWKTIERSPFFIWRGDLVGRTTFWIFFEWLAKVRATGQKGYWASWGVCWINPEFGCCSCFLPGRAKDLSAPPRSTCSF